MQACVGDVAGSPGGSCTQCCKALERRAATQILLDADLGRFGPVSVINVRDGTSSDQDPEHRQRGTG